MRILILATLILFTGSLNAAELNGVTMADIAEAEGSQLILNGIGLRKVRRFGIPIKVYVAGLYLKEKSADSDAILKDDSVKKLVMEFVRPVDRKSLINAYREGYEKNCQVECDNMSLFTEFKNLVVSVRKKNRVIFTFEKDQMTMESTGPNAKKGTLKSASLSKNVLALFINKKSPPTQEFRSAVLGAK